METNSRLPNSNNITVRKSSSSCGSSSNSDVLFTISLAPGPGNQSIPAPSILPDSPEQLRTRTHLLDTPDFRFLSLQGADDTSTRSSPMAAFLSVSCEERGINPDGNSPPEDASPLLGSCTLLRHPLHLNQKLLPPKARSLPSSCAALGQFQRSDGSFPPDDEENLFDFKYDRSVATPPPPFYADNHNTMESIQDIGGFIEATHTASNSSSNNSSSNDDSGVHMMSMEISDGIARSASVTGDGAASSLLWGPARTMGNEFCGYSPDDGNLLFPPSSLNYSSSAAAGSAPRNSGWNPIDPLDNTSPSRTDDEWRGTTASDEDRMNSSSYQAAVVKCAGSTGRQLSYIEAGTGGDRSHMGASSNSSTDTDEEFTSVLFPSSSASSTPPSHAHAQTGQAHQDIPPADWCTPVRSAEEAAAMGDDGLSTPVHSWINCAQQFIGFGANMHSRSTSCGPNTRSDNDQDDGQSLTRFLFSPVDVISVGDGENMCSGVPPDCNLFADAAGGSRHSVSSASSFVLTAMSPVIGAPLTLSVSDRSGDMGTGGAALVSPGQAVPVPSPPFLSSGCLASEVKFTVKTKPRD